MSSKCPVHTQQLDTVYYVLELSCHKTYVWQIYTTVLYVMCMRGRFNEAYMSLHWVTKLRPGCGQCPDWSHIVFL